MIKRLFAVSLVTLLVFSFAFAEVDLGSMSEDEILVLLDEIKNELEERNFGTKYVLPVGTYEIGADVPKGEYLASASEDGDHPLFRIFFDRGAFEQNNEIDWDYADEFEGYGRRIVLNEGNILKVVNSPMFIVRWELLPE